MADAKIMKYPTFDADGYPTDETLDAIKLWPHQKSRELFAFIKAAWKYPDYFSEPENGVYRIVTGGWSGNESLIAALEKNFIVRVTCWQSSSRGGLHKYELPENMGDEHDEDT